MDENERFLVDFGETTVIGGGGGTTDFNELTNRPKYDNNIMTGSTNIPKVPTKTSDLTNDSDFVESTELATVATTGKYSDLTGKPELATVATSGSYDDLSNKPTIPAAQIQSDWSQTNTDAKDYIKNKPTIPTVNDATLTITQNGTSKGTFTANDADDTTIEVSDTTYSDFTGTDGSSAGIAGLVPAPATTDAEKFLKADGTWATAGGGGDTVYSSVTTSNSSTGGAVYIGNLDSSQVEQTDPTVSDTHARYFWALPYSNTAKPGSDSINILGEITGSIARANVITLHGYGINSSSVVSIGGQYSQAGESVAVGHNSSIMSNGSGGTALGHSTKVNHVGGVALGYQASTTRAGEVNIGTVNPYYGFDNSTYRVIGGVHDGQNAHDAVTVGQVNSVIDAINSALSTNIPHIGANS